MAKITKDENIGEKVGTGPLMALRYFTMHKKAILETDGLVILDSIAYRKDAKTNFAIFTSGGVGAGGIASGGGINVDMDDIVGSGSGSRRSGSSADGFQVEGEVKDYYNVGSIKYFLDNSGISHPLYVMMAVRMMKKTPWLQVVTRVDRAMLLNYLKGKLAKCDSIDRYGPIEFPLPAPVVPVVLNTGDYGQVGGGGDLTVGKSIELTSCLAKQDTGNMITPWLISETNSENVLKELKLPDSRELFSSEPLGESLSVLKMKLFPDGVNSDAEKEEKLEKSIVNAMGPEKIEELKAKRRAVKMHEVSSIDIPEMNLDDPMSTPNTFALLRMKTPVISLSEFSFERVRRDRNSILLAKKDLLSPVMKILDSLRIKENRKSKSTAFWGQEPRRPPPVKTEVSSISYSRYDQEVHPLETDEFGINPLLSFSTGLGFVDSVKTALLEEKTKAKKPATVYRESPPTKRLRRQESTPIIIVPDMPPSLITILNAKDILEDCSFVSNEENKSLGVKRQNEIIIHRMKPNCKGKTVPFKIICNPQKLSLEDWDRVVAVFVTGKTWQFKGWPHNGNPVEICTHLNAFNLKFDEADVDANVKMWPVNVITINRHRRHLDKAAIVEFWTSVELFIANNKPSLRY